MECFNSKPRIAVMVLFAIGVLAASITAPPATAWTDPGIEELWEQFPLDDQRDAPAAPDRPDGDAGVTTPEPAPQAEPTPIPQAGSADTGSGTAAPIGLVAAGLALLVGVAGIVLILARRARRPASLPAHAPPPATPPQVPVPAGVAHAPSQSEPQPQPGARARRRPPSAGSADAAETNGAIASSPDNGRPASPEAVETNGAHASAPSNGQPASTEAAETNGATASIPSNGHRASTDAAQANGATASMPGSGRTASPRATPKKKPASKAKPKPAKAPRSQPARARDSNPKPESAPVPAAAPEVVETQTGRGRVPAQRAQECEVRWWRGYTKSQFTAIVTRADGEEICVALSPPFRWSKNEPPPQTPAAAAALRALVESLEHKGWVVAGCDDDWFAVRLRAEMAITRA